MIGSARLAAAISGCPLSVLLVNLDAGSQAPDAPQIRTNMIRSARLALAISGCPLSVLLVNLNAGFQAPDTGVSGELQR